MKTTQCFGSKDSVFLTRVCPGGERRSLATRKNSSYTSPLEIMSRLRHEIRRAEPWTEVFPRRECKWTITTAVTQEAFDSAVAFFSVQTSFGNPFSTCYTITTCNVLIITISVLVEGLNTMIGSSFKELCSNFCLLVPRIS